MREIKFRAWDKEQKKMWKWEHIKFDFVYEHQDRYILMQYTGLKDRNDRETYKGDVVDLELASLEVIKGEIVQGDSGEWLIHKSSGNYVSVYHSRDKIEVIGNIYENPKLLK